MPNVPVTWLDQVTASTSNVGIQDQPHVVQLANGNILVAWRSADNTPGTAGAAAGTDIIGRIFNAGGIPLTGEFALNTFATIGDEQNVDIAALPSNVNGFVLVYSRIDSGISKIYLERYDNNGVNQFAGAVPTTNAATVSHDDPHVAVSSNGGVMLAYTSGPTSTSTIDAMIYFVNNDSFSAQFEGIPVSLIGPGSVSDLDIAAAPGLLGFTIVAVFKSAGTSENGVYYRGLTQTGGYAGYFNAVAGTVGSTTTDSNPAISSDSNSGVVIAYRSQNGADNPDSDIKVLDVNIGGGFATPLGTVGTVSSTNKNAAPDVATLADKSVVVVYENNDATGGLEVTRIGYSGVNRYAPVGNRTPAITVLADGRLATVTYDATGDIGLEILDTRDSMESSTFGSGSSYYQVGTVGNDTFTEDAIDFFAFGGPGDDVITETSLVKTYGGDGNDRLIVTSGVGGELHDGGAGIDTLDFASSNTGGIILNLAAGTVRAVGGTAVDQAVNFENAVGTVGADFITGTTGDNVLSGAGGPDTLTGGDGADLFTGIWSELGNDTIVDFSPRDRIGISGLAFPPGYTLGRNILVFNGIIETSVGPGGSTYAGVAIPITLTNPARGRLVATSSTTGYNEFTLVSTTLADANGDGRSDIFWRNADGRIADWTGNLDGSFTGNNASIASISPDWKVVGKGDFNGDGWTDILFRNDDGTTADWLGYANGLFTPNFASVISISNDWKIAGTGDFNGDGRADIVWRNDDGRYVNWLANANGVFAGNGASAGTISTVWKIAGTGDFNGDGRSDILWRNDDGTLADWLSNASAVFVPNNPSVLGASAAFTVAGTGDLNDDGRSDVVLRSAAGQLINYIALRDGRLARDAASSVNIGATNVIADTGDYNYDGLTDILVRAADGTVGSRLALAPSLIPNGAATNFVTNDWKIFGNRDFNGDGRADILWRNDNGQFGTWLGQADGSYMGNSVPLVAVTTDWYIATTGDFNGDGRADILWRNNNGTIGRWSANADASFTANNAALQLVTNDWKIFGSGDFNGDGRSDILWRNDNGTIADWLGTTSGGFVPNNASLASVSLDWKIAGTGDFNGDGRADILWRNDNGTVGNWFGNPDGSFTGNPTTVLVGTAWHVAGTGDYDGDGRSDMLVRNSATGALRTWLATTDNSFAQSLYLSADVPTAWKIVGSGDANGNGLADILWRNDNGTLTDYLTRGTGFSPTSPQSYGVGTDWQVVH